MNLTSGVVKGRSRIDTRVIKAAKNNPRKILLWVKGHSGVEGNEKADKRAKDTVMRAQWMSDPCPATPAGIRQAYPLFHRAPHLKWGREVLRGLTYLHTDKGPQRAGLHQIGRAEDLFCGCGETPGAAHLMSSRSVAGKKRKWQDIWTDRVFCAEVASFLRSDRRGRGQGGGGGETKAKGNGGGERRGCIYL